MNASHWQLIGWTMLHFLWIGTLLAVFITVVRLTLRRAAPNVRYMATLFGFTLLAMSPLAIAGWLIANGTFADNTVAKTIVEPVVVLEAPAGPLVTDAQAAEEVIDLKYNPIEVPAETPSEPQPMELPTTLPADIDSLVEPQEPARLEPLAVLTSVLEAVTNYLPWLWLVGTPLTFLLLATGLIGGERLRRQATLLTEGPAYEAAARLRKSLGIARSVSIAVSDRVVQPVLLGIVRPLILLPPAVVTGWTLEEIEMALAHELAHVRRWDNLVNFVQRVVESLLFFHPAVWLVSRWLREGREQCCDAVVVAHCGDREGYAELLVNVAKLSHNRRLPSMAVALSTHPLAQRVRRILQLEDNPMLVSKRTLLFVGALFVAVTVAAFWRNSSANEPVGEPEASAPRVEEAAPGVEEGTTEDTEGLIGDEVFLLNPGMTKDQLATIESQLNNRGKKVHITVDGNRVKVTYDGVSTTCTELRLIGGNLEASNGSSTVKFDTGAGDHVYDLAQADIDPALDDASMTYDFTDDTPYAEVLKVIAAHEKAGDEVKIVRNNGDVMVVVKPKEVATPDAPGAVSSPARVSASGSPDSPFLPLEDQRVADLAYGMLGVEITSLDAEELAAVKEKGFGGGVKVDGLGRIIFAGSERRSSTPTHDSDWRSGDILVGLHVWPTGSFEQLGEVLRRDDLQEFNPLKYYVLRKEVDPDWEREQLRKAQEAERQREREREERASGPARGFGGRGGGEFGGEFGGRGGYGMGRGNEAMDATGADIPYVWKLHTGRIGFGRTAWVDEQARLKKAADERKESLGSGPNFQQVAPGVGVPMVSEEKAEATETEKPVSEHVRSERAKAKLLYDGRTFDEWRDSFETELKAENRTEAIKAIRAFGRAGYGKEATETILEVARPYQFNTWGQSTPEGKLVSAIIESLSGNRGGPPLPATITVPLLTKRYEEDPDQHKWLLWHALCGVQPTDKELEDGLAKLATSGDAEIRNLALAALIGVDGKLSSTAAREAVDTNLGDTADKNVAIQAASVLLENPPSLGGGGLGGGSFGNAGTTPVLRTLPAGLRTQLFVNDFDVRRNARRVLQYASEEQLGELPEKLLAVAQDPTVGQQIDDIWFYTVDEGKTKQGRLAAIRALAALGPKAKDQWQPLAELLKHEDFDTKVAACVAVLEMFEFDVASLEKGDTDQWDSLPESLKDAIDSAFQQMVDRDVIPSLVREKNIVSPPRVDFGGGFGSGGGDFGSGGAF